MIHLLFAGQLKVFKGKALDVCVCGHGDLPLYRVIGINTQTHMRRILNSLSLLIGLCEHTSCRCVLNCKMVFAKDVSIITT